MEQKTEKKTINGTKLDEQKQDFIEQNKTLLNKVFETAKRVAHSIEHIIPLSENTAFQNLISAQHAKYEVIASECLLLAKADDCTLCQIDCFAKFKAWLLATFGALLDPTTRGLTQMLYLNTCHLLPELIFAICDAPNANKETLELSKKLQDHLLKTMDELQTFLCVKDEKKDSKPNKKTPK